MSDADLDDAITDASKGGYFLDLVRQTIVGIIGVLLILSYILMKFLRRERISTEFLFCLICLIVIVLLICLVKIKRPKWFRWGLEYIFVGAGLLIGIVPIIYDLMESSNHKLSVISFVGLFLSALLFFFQAISSAKSDHLKVTEQLETLQRSTDKNTNILKSHEHLFTNRMTDKLHLVAFENLLAYLPFYLAQDLGYFRDEKIEIHPSTLTSVNDEETAEMLDENSSSAVAICDPYMCLTHAKLKVVFPISQGSAVAWPMTLNWIGSTAASKDRVRIAAYKAPSTTHVLARLVKEKIVDPQLQRSPGGITSEVVGLDESEARSIAGREDIRAPLRRILEANDVVMLWEPHCEIARTLGARFLEQSSYEKALTWFTFPLMYSALIMSKDLIDSNPTLPSRMRRALDRAVARLQDPDRLKYSGNTLDNRGLLSGFEVETRKSVLDRLVASVPVPIDAGERGAPGWEAATESWAQGMFAAHRLRESLHHVKSGPAISPVGGAHYNSAGDFRSLIYSQDIVDGRM